MTILAAQNLTKHFGGINAVEKVNLSINEGLVTGLIGPNGAGKTTIFNLLTGFLTPTEGNVIFNGNDITGKPPFKIAEKGLVRTFQIAETFQEETALQSILIACHCRENAGLFRSIFRTKSARKEEDESVEKAKNLLDFIGMAGEDNTLVNTLPLGHQSRLQLAMVLATGPKVICLDEILGGMTHGEISEVLEVVEKIKEKGITILFVEHNVRSVMAISDIVLVLNQGRLICEGTPEEVSKDQAVIDAYLGEEED